MKNKFLHFLRQSSRRLISFTTTVWAPVPALYWLAMPTRFSIVSRRAVFGVMSADIRDLKKYGELKINNLTECGRLRLIELLRCLFILLQNFEQKRRAALPKAYQPTHENAEAECPGVLKKYKLKKILI